MNGFNPFVSVIIPTHNRRELLTDTVGSLFSQSYPKDRYEIIIVDNSSIDGTDALIQLIQKDAPCIVKYYKKVDEGPGSSRNLGISKANGNIIAFIDDDCKADCSWIENGVAKMIDKVGLVQGKTLPNPHQKRRTFSHTQEITEENCSYQTCNIFYRTDALNMVGGFSSDFIGLDRFGVPMWGGEDTDLGWKVKEAGWKSVFADDAVVYHHVFDVSPWNVFKSLISYKHCRHFFHILPCLFKKHPDLRSTNIFYNHFFLGRERAYFAFSIVSIVLGIQIHPLLFLPVFPYAVHLLTRSFYDRTLGRYPQGVIVLFIFLLRDFIDFILLALGSIRHRSIVL